MNYLNAQNSYNYLPQVYPKSPEAFQLYKYEKIPVSEYSGVPNINLPLYTLKEGNIEIPIILNYNGGGIKIEEESTRVGLGWSLSLPSITQIKNGLNDLRDPSGINLTKDIDGFNKIIRPYYFGIDDSPWVWPKSFPDPANFNYNSLQKSPEIITRTFLSATSIPLQNYGMIELQNAIFGVDFEEDIFKMNLFGKIVNFKRDVNLPFGNFISTNEYNYKFQIIYDKNIYPIRNRQFSWIITDPQGIKYYFEYEIRIPDNNPTAVTEPSVWYLNKIIDTNNNIVNINYEKLDFESYPNNSPCAKINYFGKKNPIIDLAPFSGLTQYITLPNIGSKSNYPIKDLRTNFAGESYSIQYGDLGYTEGFSPTPTCSSPFIKTKNSIGQEVSIISSKEKILYFYSNREDIVGAKKLDSIEIRNINDIKVKSIKFNYGYFVANEPNLSTDPTINKKLKLNNICINDQCTFFNYYEQFLPRKDSKANDYWGYYNGNYSNSSNYPEILKFLGSFADTQFNAMLQTNDNHASRGDYAKAASIREIIYPTKGKTTYDYELNEFTHVNQIIPNYDQVQNQIAKGWGIRISRIFYNDGNDNKFSTKYQYSGGKAIRKFEVVKNMYGISHTYLMSRGAGNNGQSVWSEGYNDWVIAYLNNQYSPNLFDNSNDIGYDIVTKIELDKDDNEKGAIISEYTNTSETNFGTNVTYSNLNISGILDKNKNGLLKKQTYMNKQGETIKVIENEYNYFYKLPIDYGFITLYNANYALCNNLTCLDAGPLYYMVYYPKVYNQANLSKTYIREYFNGKPYITTKSYTYNTDNQLKNEKTEFSDGSYKSIGYSYSKDWNLQKLIDNNIIGVPIYESHSSNFESKEFLTKYEDSIHLNPTSVIEYNQRINGSETTTDTIITYDKYDNKGNLQQFTTKSGIPTTIIWGYNQTQPIAKIEGAKYDDVKALQVVLDATSSSNSDAIDPTKEADLITALDKLRDDSKLKNYQISTYTYDPLIGVTSITPSNGIREIYKYDKANRLQSIVDFNGNILKEYKYKYVSNIYYNFQRSQTFTKNNCGANSLGGTYIYTVPANKYFSYISQSDADQKGLNDINSNGQNAANIYGTCTSIANCSIVKATYFNQYISGNISSNYSLINVNLSLNTDTSIYNWSTWVNVAKISGSCIPKVEKTSACYANGSNWGIKIDTSGNVYAKIDSGSTSNMTTVSLNFNYSNN